jgi:8-oxo-dGTP pyrophosphatase MutT (NUDIX family)
VNEPAPDPGRAAGLWRWPALAAARHAELPRVPFFVRGVVVGSVARAHLAALHAFGRAVRVDAAGVHALDEDPSEALAPVNHALHEAGLVRAWRDELFALPHPGTLQTLARIERAAARFWGTLTLGAHANGFVRGADGRPSHLWVAQRSFNMATDPGKFDNLVGGGVGLGQTPRQTLVREAFEEAGLAPDEAAGARAGSVIGLARDIAEGFQREWLYAFDVELPEDRTPVNVDGEVAGFRCLDVTEAAALAAGETMTVDAALVTLDFLLRHHCLPADERELQRLRAGLDALLVTPPR